MSDLFDEFVFDLQRFATGSTTYGNIGGYSAKPQPDKFYWAKGAESIAITDVDGTRTHADKAVVNFNLSGTTKQYVESFLDVAPAPLKGKYGLSFADSSGSGIELSFHSEDGKFHFGMSSGAIPQNVHFVTTNDALTLTDEAIDAFRTSVILDANNTEYKLTEKIGFDLGENIKGSDVKSLTLKDASDGTFSVDGLSAGDGFTVFGFSAADKRDFGADAEIRFLNGPDEVEPEVSSFAKATEGGYVDFNLAGKLNISVKSGGAVIVNEDSAAPNGGISALTDLTVNGTAVTLSTDGFAYDNTGDNKEKSPVLYLTDVDFGGESEALERQVLGFTIGKENASVKGLSEDYSGFVLSESNNGSIAGFVFANADSAATLILEDANLKNFVVYDGDISGEGTLISLPSVTNASVVGIAKSQVKDDAGKSQSVFSLVVTDGAVVSDSDTNITVNSSASEFVQVVFDTKTGEIKGIVTGADPRTAATAGASFGEGISFNVEDAPATYADQKGLYIGGSLSTFGGLSHFISTANNKYTYSIGSIDIALGNGSDTIFGLDNATNLKLDAQSGTIVDATDGDGKSENDPSYTYVNASGSAYFTLGLSSREIVTYEDPFTKEKTKEKATTAYINGFVFAGQSDALTMDENVPTTGFGLSYIGASGAETPLPNTPVVGGVSSYTVEMTEAYNEDTKLAKFAVTDFSNENATVSFGGSFVFGEMNDEFLFDSQGNAVGFNASDTVAMDAKAATFLDGTKGGSFFINGEDVNIVAVVGEDGLLYNASDSSLFGLSSGTTINGAGNIEKVYASEGKGEFQIGSASYVFTAMGESVGERAFFNVSGSTATGFTFQVENDALQITNHVPREFTLTDDDSGKTVTAPFAYVSESSSIAVDAYTITKGQSSLYEISGLSDGNYVEMQTAAGSSASITLKDVSASAAIVYDMKTQALVGFDELTDGDAIKVAGVSTAVDFNVDEKGDDTVEITGDNVSFTYTYGPSATLTDVNAYVTIKQVGGASYVGSASGVNGIGTYTFAIEGASVQTFGVSNYDSADINGVKFMLGSDSTVTAINDLEDTEFVDGFSADFAGVKINGQSFAVEGGSGLFIAVQGDANAKGANSIYLQEMKDAEPVVVKATAGASTVLAANIEEIAFGTASAFTIAGTGSESGLKTGIEFTLNGLNVAGISDVDAQESISGYFGGVSSVNGVSFDVTDKDAIMIVGSESNVGITKIADVSGSAVINNVGGASEVVTDTEGLFSFAGHSIAFEVTGDSSVIFQMVDNAAASVLGVNDFGNAGTSATLSGLLQGLTINGSSAAIVIEGDSDSVFDYMVDANGENATLGGVGNENGDVVTITETAGASFVQTNAAGTFKFAGGQSFTTDDKSLTFELNDAGEVVAIYGLDNGSTIKGSFSSAVEIFGEDGDNATVKVVGDDDIVVENDAIIIKNLDNGATIAVADSVTNAWTTMIGLGTSSIAITDADKHSYTVEGGTDADGVNFVLDGKGHINGVSSLGEGIVLRGSFAGLSSVNGQTFGVTETATVYGGDGQFAIVGASNGIGAIVGLGGSVAINDAGGAIAAITDDNALITFKDGNQFYAGGFSAKPEVGFIMDKSNAVAIVGVSSNELVMGSGSAFEGIESVNDKDFDVKGASAVVVVGNDDNDGLTGIAVFGGSNVVVNKAASATDVLAAYVKQITFGESSTFQIEGESSATFVSFEIDSALNVGAVSYVGAQESVTGDFTDVNTVNGKSFNVQNDNELAVVGNENSDGISVIGLVSDGALINDVGGASMVITDEEGEFNFAGHNDAFSVVGDDSVTFNMSTSAPAIVKGITDFATTGESFAMVVGNLNGLSINDKGTIDVEGDADDVLAYAKETYEGEDFYGLSVSGANVTINSAASANIIQTADGVYTFAMDKDAASTTYTVATAGDSAVLFEVEGNDVVGILDMDKDSSVTGNFSKGAYVEGISTSGVLEDGSVQILNDSVVTVVYDAFEVRNLSNGASITSFTDFKDAYTDAATDSLTVTDADGDEFTVENDADGVHYLLDGKGNIIGVEDLDEDATLKGSLGALSSVNGKDFDVKETILNYGGLSSGDGQFAIVGGSNGNGIGAIVNLGGGVVVNNGGGASKFVTDDNIFITSGGESFVVIGIKENPAAYVEDITPSTVAAELIEQIAPYVTTKSDGVEFVTDGKDNITAINGLSGNELVATFGQSLTGGEFPINDQDLHIEGDVNLVAAVGTDDFDGISALVIGGSSSVQLVKAAGASAVLALDVDEITFGESSTFTIESSKDVPGVGFDISGVDVKAVALLGDNESVTGNFNDIDSVNEKKFNVTDDEIMVVGTENVDAVSKIAKVSDGAIIANVAGASQVITDTEGEFNFVGHNDAFSVEGDESVTFQMVKGAAASVAGITDFATSGESVAMVIGNLNGLSINDKGTIDVEGDADNILAYAAEKYEGETLFGLAVGGSNVTVKGTAEATFVAATTDGEYTFDVDDTADPTTFEVNSTGDSAVLFEIEGNNVVSILDFNKNTSVTGDFSNGAYVEGISSTGEVQDIDFVQITGDPDVTVVYDDFEVRQLSNGASISSATTVYKAFTDAANLKPLTVIDASGDEFTVYGDADGVMYSLNGAGEIIAVDGLAENATLGGAIGQLKSINGKDFDIVEEVNTYHGQSGDGVYSVVGSASGISKVIGLGGNVTVNNAGGATELVTDDEIVLRANDKRIHIRNDSSVTFGVSGVNDIVSLDDFGGMSNATAILDANSAGINGLEINGNGAVSVVGDGNDKLIFKDENGDATLTGIDNLNDSQGATIYSSAYADKVKTSGDGLYNFGGKQEFIVIGEGEGGNRSADAAKNSVWYDVANDSVNAISSLNGSIAGDFTTPISVNGEQIQVLGDSGVIVVGTGSVDSAATNVSALEAVNAGATVVSWGSASHVGVLSDKGSLSSYQFIGADKQAQNYIAADTNDSYFSFTTDKDKVTGVEDLIDGYISFNPNETGSASLNVNVAHVPNQTMTFASTQNVSLTVDPYEVVIVEGVNGSVSGVVGKETPATVIGSDGLTSLNVNGKEIFVDDNNDQFNVVVHNTTPDYVYNVDGDATVIAESVSVRANSAGSDTNPTKDTFVIAGESYVFDDSKDENDGFTFVTDKNGTLNKVVSLEGALVINDGEWSGNINGDDFEVIDYPNNVNPPVTVNSGASGIESVGGLDHKDTVNGDLGAAQVHIPGYDEEGGHYPGTTITINGKPYTVVTDPDGVDVTGDKADVITDLDKEASLVGAEGAVSVNGTALEPEEGDVIKGDSTTNTHARIVGNDELIRQATAINHYNHRGYDIDTEETTAAAFNIEDVVGLPTYTGAPFYYLDRDSSDYAQIVAGTSLAVIDFDQPMVISLENVDSLTDEAYKTEQVFDMSSYSYTKKVYMNGEGPQGVKFNNEGGNLAVVAAGSTGVKNVSLGSGGDAVVMDEDYALQNAVNIYGGVGNDSVFVRHNANTYVDFSAGGSDILVTAGEANARVTIGGYNASTGAAIRVEEYLDVENETAGTIAEGIENGIISFGEGTVIITSDEGQSEIYLGTNGNGGQIVNLMTHASSGDDYKQAVGFTGVDGGLVDGSTYTSPLIMIGNNQNTDNAGSSLIGGSANDTFYGGANDFISTGYGNDYVSLFNDSLRAGATVQIGDGRTTIDGMNNSLADSTGDVISVAIDPQDATFSLVYNESLGTVEIESAADGYYAVLTDVDTLEGNYTTQYIYDEVGTELYSVAIGTVNSTIKVTEDEDLRPNVFFGYQTAIDFRDYTGDAIIDLRGDMAESIIDETIVIIDDDITTLYAGAGDTALKGDLDDETLFAGKGNTWLYGDGGKNLLVGYEGADKEGQTVFYVLGNEDGAAHTISGFNYVTDDNFTDTKKVTADALEFDLDDNNISRIDISGNDLVIEITDKAGNDTESALLKNAINADGTGKDFIVSDNVAQVADNHLVFDQFADYYYATGKNATVEVSGRIEDDVVLWLDEDETGKVFEGDIAVIDATGSDATAQLAGNENDNAIFAGTGETSLWGGEGGNDLLVGNAGGRDTFYYSSGNGDDTITNVKDGDVIALDVSLDQIDEIDMSDASAIRIIMNDGDVLTINDAGHDVNVMIDNGEDGTDTYSTREARSRQ